jgi:GrpB-like predicted nucleotidyltransferase (UPF0157 family)
MGEERDPAVRIVDYDPGWPEEARQELARVGAALGDLAVRLDHVGSTAVPGLAAKPIVDLQVSVAAAADSAVWTCSVHCSPSHHRRPGPLGSSYQPAGIPEPPGVSVEFTPRLWRFAEREL